MIIQETITNLTVHQYNTNIIIILTKYYTKHNNITHHNTINIYETDRLILCDKFVHFVGFKFKDVYDFTIGASCIRPLTGFFS